MTIPVTDEMIDAWIHSCREGKNVKESIEAILACVPRREITLEDAKAVSLAFYRDEQDCFAPGYARRRAPKLLAALREVFATPPEPAALGEWSQVTREKLDDLTFPGETHLDTVLRLIDCAYTDKAVQVLRGSLTQPQAQQAEQPEPARDVPTAEERRWLECLRVGMFLNQNVADSVALIDRLTARVRELEAAQERVRETVRDFAYTFGSRADPLVENVEAALKG